MNEDHTKQLTDGDKLDLILREIQSLSAKLSLPDERVATLEAKSYDTRPLWERALAELFEVKQQGTDLKRAMRQMTRQQNILNNEFLHVKGDWSDLEDRIITLEQQAERPSA